MKWLLCVLSLGLSGMVMAADEAAPSEAERKRILAYENEVARLEKKAEEAQVQPGGIVCIGSSSIRMYNVKQAFPELPILNCGFGGSQMADSVYYFDRLVLKHKPRIVVLYAGDNDIASGKTPAQVIADFEKFVGRMQADLPESKLLYISIKPSPARWGNISKVRQANHAIRRLIEKGPRMEFVDVEPAMLDDKGEPIKDLFVDDMLHMNDKGYAVWTKLLEPHLK